jgi:NADPH:quinone reductase-like Zn-dependent oxidoreductase
VGYAALYRKDSVPFREDLPTIFALLADKKIDPPIAHTFPLLSARQAIELPASGSIEGKIVLTSGDHLTGSLPLLPPAES